MNPSKVIINRILPHKYIHKFVLNLSLCQVLETICLIKGHTIFHVDALRFQLFNCHLDWVLLIFSEDFFVLLDSSVHFANVEIGSSQFHLMLLVIVLDFVLQNFVLLFDKVSQDVIKFINKCLYISLSFFYKLFFQHMHLDDL